MLIPLLFVVCGCAFVECEILTQPEQVHLALTEDGTGLTVTWVTQQATKFSTVEFGQQAFTNKTQGTQDIFVDDGLQKRKFYNHRATFPPLISNTRYVYHVGSESDGWSEVYWFTSPRAGNNWSPRFAIYGDMGNKNAQSMARLQEEAQRGHFDAILHVGDFAYNMDDDNARVGDAFMNQIQAVSGYLPYMTCVGNHEQAYNFSNYKSRFTMPKAGGDGHNLFYSFNMGPVHVIAFSSEIYYYVEYGWDLIVKQYEWLQNDLKEANKAENRAVRPWIITMCHRPLYCSNSNDDEHCMNEENIIRVGIPSIHTFGIEDLLYKYGVDVHLQAHEHSYERMFPVYNRTLCKGQTKDPHLYVNPQSPVHLVTGSAGCQEGVDPFEPAPHPWSATHSDDYGYTRLIVHNITHLSWQQVSDDQDGAIIDHVTVVKKEHRAGLFNC